MAKSKKKTEEMLDDVQVELNDAQEETPVVESVVSELPQKEKNAEELLLSYIDKQEGEDVEINDFLEKLYSVPEAPIVAKMAFQLIEKLSFEGKIKMSNTNWNDLS